MSGPLTTTWEVAQTPNLCHILCHPWALKGICFALRTPSHIVVGAPSTQPSKNVSSSVKCVRAGAGLVGMIKTDCYNHFGAPNLQHHTENVWAVPRPPLMSTIPPNMLTNWHKFGLHRPTYTRVLLTALQGIGKREKTSRRWSRNVANFK